MENVIRLLIVFGGTLAVTIALGWAIDRGLRYWSARHPKTTIPGLLRRIQLPLQLFLGFAALRITYPLADLHLRQDTVILSVLASMVTMSAVWLVVRIVDAVADGLLNSYSRRARDPRRVRQLNTQFTLIRRITTALLAVATAAIAMLVMFPGLRVLGTSLLASAGIIGIIAGVAAQSTLSNLMAGLQIAFGDSVKIGDTVVVEGEMGTVEEITLSFLTVRIWDDRRLTMPVSYFNSKPYENWSRGGPQMTGTVFLYLDHSAPVADLREHLYEYLSEHPDWDGRSWNLLVTDSTPTGIEVRASMTGRDSDAVWSLRCAVREELISWLNNQHPGALPRLAALDGFDKTPVR
ncbi:mechanosensitive ion channel family protein [Nocardia zapadnayensis]|uniref:mechanosensitive ion channel family protein n=1 Tax=Nocardia rhamnosiphila TaxID=426716 RepID=UPI0022463A1D|nr:mechanosensitive ion channel domain-containing protein [Nocardia zapadnayensis]MCX0273763.1 mechanosensitive ion channel family protein [Nocardia zapadnayensis]